MGTQTKNSTACEKGDMYITLDRPHYYPGSIVKGQLVLSLRERLEGESISLFVTGQEKAKYLVYGDDSRRFEKKRELINFKTKVYEFQQALEAGDYIIPFEFKMPKDTPATILYEFPESENFPGAAITYFLKA